MTGEDVAVLKLDEGKLAASLAAALALNGQTKQEAPDVVRLGSFSLTSRRPVPVTLLWPSLHSDREQRIAVLIRAVGEPFILLTPTRTSLSLDIQADLRTAGREHLVLAELVGCDRAGELSVTEEVSTRLAAFGQRVENLLGGTCAPPPWHLPAGARWEELTIEFQAEELVHARFRGQTRRFGPSELGMSNANSGRPTQQWLLLKILAKHGGELSWRSPQAHVKYKKQKQKLADKLKYAFGLEDDPLPWDAAARAYRARFMLRGDDRLALPEREHGVTGRRHRPP